MPKKPKDFDQTVYVNGYIKEKYDRINLLFPKGYKDEIKRRAVEKGISASRYITDLIDHDTRTTVRDIHINTDEIKSQKHPEK